MNEASTKQQIIDLEQQVIDLKAQLQEYKDLIDHNIDEINTNNPDTDNDEKSTQKEKAEIDWTTIHEKFESGDDKYILQLIHTNIIDVLHDTDENGHNLWCLACGFGALHVVKMCVNLGVDVTFTDKHGNDGLFYARNNRHYDIVQYLVLQKIGAGKAEEIVKDSNRIWDEDGVLSSFLEEMKLLNPNDYKCMKENIVRIVIRMIDKKQPISSFLQNLSMVLNAPKTWKAIEKIMDQTIKNTQDSKAWYYLDKYLLNNNTLLFRKYLLTEAENEETDKKQEDEETDIDTMTTSKPRFIRDLNTDELVYFIKHIFAPNLMKQDNEIKFGEARIISLNASIKASNMNGKEMMHMSYDEIVKLFQIKAANHDEKTAKKMASYLSSISQEKYEIATIIEPHNKREVIGLNSNELKYFIINIFIPSYNSQLNFGEKHIAIIKNAIESENINGSQLISMGSEQIAAFFVSNGLDKDNAHKISSFLSNQRKLKYAIPHIAENEYGYDKMYEKAFNESAHQAQIEISAIFENEESENWDFVKNYGKQYMHMNPRQDTLKNGIIAKFSKEFIIQNMSKKTVFNPIKFYDIEVYLDELMLQSSMIDDQFQHDVNTIFPNTDSVTFRRGPLKQVKRCKVKVEGDYFMESFPTSACIKDIVRCTVIFADFKTMINGIKLFEEQIKSQKYCLKEICRIKNGFIDYDPAKPNYVDIKYNVRVYCSNGVNIIAEVQFLLQKMASFKVKAHKYYNIIRKKDYFINLKQVSLIKNNIDKQIMVMAKTGNHKGIMDILIKKQVRTLADLRNITSANSCLTQIYKNGNIKSLKVFLSLCKNDKEIETFLARKVDGNDSDQNGVIICCKYGQLDMLTFILSLCSCNYAEQLLTSTDTNGRTPFIQSSWNGRIECVKYIVSKLENKDEIKQVFATTDLLGKSGLMLASWKGFADVVRFILSECETQQEKMELIQMRESINDKTGQTAFALAVIGGQLAVMQLLLKPFEEIGANKLTEMLYNYKRNALMLAVINNKKDMVEFMLQNVNKEARLRLIEQQDFYGNNIFMLASQYEQPEIAEFILNQLENNQSKIKLINAKNKKDETALSYAKNKRHQKMKRAIEKWIKQFSE